MRCSKVKCDSGIKCWHKEWFRRTWREDRWPSGDESEGKKWKEGEEKLWAALFPPSKTLLEQLFNIFSAAFHVSHGLESLNIWWMDRHQTEDESYRLLHVVICVYLHFIVPNLIVCWMSCLHCTRGCTDIYQWKTEAGEKHHFSAFTRQIRGCFVPEGRLCDNDDNEFDFRRRDLSELWLVFTPSGAFWAFWLCSALKLLFIFPFSNGSCLGLYKLANGAEQRGPEVRASVWRRWSRFLCLLSQVLPWALVQRLKQKDECMMWFLTWTAVQWGEGNCSVGQT